MPSHRPDDSIQDESFHQKSPDESISIESSEYDEQHPHSIFSTQPRLALSCILVHQDWLIGGSDHHSGFLFAWPLHSTSEDQQQKPIVLHHHHQKSIQALHSIGNYWFSSARDGTLRQWNSDLECIGTIYSSDPNQSFITCMASSNEEESESTPFYTGGTDGSIRKWIWTDQEQVQKAELTFLHQECKGWISSLAVIEKANNDSIGHSVVAGYSDHCIRLWDDTTGYCTMTLQGHQDAVCSLAIHAKTTLISGSKNGQVIVWDLKNGSLLKLIQASQDPIRSLQVIPSGHFDFLLSMGDDKLVQIWDLLSLKKLKTLSGHFGGIRSGLYSQAKQALFTASRDGTVRKWAISSQSATLTGQAAQWLHSTERGKA